MKRLFALFVALSLVAAGVAQDAPKKDEPKPEEKKAEPKKADPKDEKPGEGEEVDVQKTAERIAENAQKAGDRLKEKDPGEDTRKIQQEILKDIDALLRKAQQPPPPSDMPPPMPPMMPPPKSDMPPPKSDMPMPKDNPGGGGSGGGQQPMTGSPMGGGGGGSQQKSSGSSGGNSNGKAERRPRKDRRPQGGQPMGTGNETAKGGPGGEQPMPMKPEPKEGPMGGGQENPGDNGGRPKESKLSPKRQNDKLADLYKDVWGTLPDRMRQEMDLYYREQFMPRYSELLRQYYASLAEQRKKAGEDR